MSSDVSCVEAPEELASSLSSKWNEEESSAEDQPEAAAAVIRGPLCNGSHAASTSIGVVLVIVKLKVSWPLDARVYGVKGMNCSIHCSLQCASSFVEMASG